MEKGFPKRFLNLIIDQFLKFFRIRFLRPTDEKLFKKISITQ